MNKDIRKEREVVWLQILYLFVIPILLLYFNIIPDSWRLVMLLFVGLILYGITRHEKWTSLDFGVRKDFMCDIIPYSLFTISAVLFLLWLSQITPHSPFLNWWGNRGFLLLFAPISILQEIIFRGILMKFLEKVFSNPFTIIIINASVFAFMHVIYLNSIFVLPMTFIAGIGFAWMYYKYPNLILISGTHTVVNFLAMVLGFFVLR